VILLWLTPGEIFGTMALLATPSSYLVGTEPLKDSWALEWHRPVLRDLAARYPQLLENALLKTSDYLGWYLATHMALISQSARRRVARVLISLAQTIGKRVPEGIEFDATNEELANASNITPFTTSRLFSEWQRNGALVKRRGKILLRSPERLFLHKA